MKKFFNFNLLFAGMIMAASALSFAACSDDDDNNDGNGGGTGNLGTPEYRADAAKFNITDANSQYASLELTASGDYILTEKNSAAYAPKGKANAPYVLKAENNSTGTNTTTNLNGIHTGKYTKNSDGTYTLEGFGTVTVGENTLTITLQDGTTATWSIEKQQKVNGSYNIDDLCRTWTINKYNLLVKQGDKTLFNKDFKTFDELMAFIESNSGDEEAYDDNSDDEWDWMLSGETVTISEYGTLAILARVYVNGVNKGRGYTVLAWRPTGDNKGTMFSGDEYDDTMSMEVKDGKLYLVYDESDPEDGLSMKTSYIYNAAAK